jgi:prephenate dehydrogenase
VKSDSEFARVGVVGFGLVGSSICGLIDKEASDVKLTIIEPSCDHRDVAFERHPSAAVYIELENIKECDLVIVCTYVRDTAKIISEILNMPDFEGVVLDAGSVKKTIIDEVLATTDRADRYIPGHPMAGRNVAGPHSGSPEIMTRQKFLLSDHPVMNLSHLSSVERFLTRITFDTKIINAERHDEILSVTSHFPHVLAYALARQLNGLSNSVPMPDLGALSGRSIRTVIDFSSPNTAMWEQILIANKDNIIREGEDIISTLTDILDAVRNDDEAALRKIFQEGADGRAQLLS